MIQKLSVACKPLTFISFGHGFDGLVPNFVPGGSSSVSQEPHSGYLVSISLASE